MKRISASASQALIFAGAALLLSPGPGAASAQVILGVPARPAFSPQIPAIISRPASGDNLAPRDYAQAVERFARYVAGKKPGIKNPDNLPFLLTHGRKTQRAILMVHGLADSPYYMRALANVFHESGYNVIGILLPGHGTRPEDLLHVDLEEWQREVEFGLAVAQELGDVVSMSGFSTGGALILDALAKNYASRLRLHSAFESPIPGLVRNSPRDIEDIFLFSPALKIADKRVKWGCQIPWLVTIFRPYREGDVPETKPFNYNKMAINAVCQLYDLTVDVSRGRENILSSIGDHNIGVFTVQSEADGTVRADAVVEFMKDLPPGAAKNFILYPKDEGIRHADVTRPETNPFYAELQKKIREFVARKRQPALGPRLQSDPQSRSLDYLRSWDESGTSLDSILNSKPKPVALPPIPIGKPN
ncbi:MAG TPA: hypothetical protein DEB40_12600 [Elusimicrobia bacterium]|nr:hypothetical protein [Elusimicrobiota bacterium]HBT62573.1 hypothetical protein [Elusimicrobiota bacterium]